jgi:hypothetical protein
MLDYFKLPRVPYLITRDDEGWYNEYETFKDVQLLGRDMDSVLLVEDSVPYARVSCNNSVIVPSYRGEPTDQVLRNLTELLQQMVTSRGGMGVPQFLKENVQSPLFVPLPSFMGEYDWSTIPHAAQPNLPPIEDHAVCCVAADYAPSSPKRSRKGDIKTYKKQKARPAAGRRKAAAAL